MQQCKILFNVISFCYCVYLGHKMLAMKLPIARHFDSEILKIPSFPLKMTCFDEKKKNQNSSVMHVQYGHCWTLLVDK